MQAAVVGDEQFDEGLSVVEFEALALDFILAQLDLQEVVAEGYAGLDCGLGVLGEVGEQGIGSIERALFFLKGDELPVVLFGLCFDIALREA